MARQSFIIIGGVAAGMSAASKIRSIDAEAEIRVFEKSGFVSYIACGMPYFIEGKVASSKNLVVFDSNYFKEKRNIEVFLHHEVKTINPAARTVLVRNLPTGEEMSFSYDKLLVSTGARPVQPPIKGADLPGVFILRQLEHGLAIQDYMNSRSPQKGLIIGAGSIGMEMAEAFAARGLEVTVVEKMPSILGSMDDEINQVVEDELKQKKVNLIKSRAVAEFTGAGSTLKSALLDNGEILAADIALVGAGIRPNSEIAREAGIETGQNGAIKVNDHMQTNLPDIYAAGDCAEAYHLVLKRNAYMPLGTTANKQGRVAGNNMAGVEAAFAGIVGTAVFKVFDLEVGRTGLSEKDALREGLECVTNTIEQTSRAHYFPGVSRIRVKLVAEKNTGRLLGAQAAGKEGIAKRIDIFATAITAGMTAQQVESLDLGYAPPLAPVYDPVLIAASELQKKIRG